MTHTDEMKRHKADIFLPKGLPRLLAGWLGCLLLVVAGCLACGCSDDLPVPEEPAGQAVMPGYINVTVSMAKASETVGATRATEPGADPYNENRIDSLTVFLWPNGADWTESMAPMVREKFSDLNAVGQATVRIPLTAELQAHLFNQDMSNTCRIFAVANCNADAAETVAEVRKMVVDSKFATQQVQPNFVMDGTSTVELFGNSAVGIVEMQRVAAKVDLHLKGATPVEEKVGEETVVWTPMLDNTSVRLQRGVSKSQVNPDARAGVPDDDYFDTPHTDVYTYGFRQAATPDDEHPGPGSSEEYSQDIPFYTYPNVWGKTTPDTRQTMMILTLPWVNGAGEYRTCYYQVPCVPLDKDELVRNVSYHVNLTVGILGSTVPEDPTPLEDLSYTAAPWGEVDVDAQIEDVRYLVLDQHEFVMNNVESLNISYTTSHPTVVTDIYMTFSRFNMSDEGNEFKVTVSRTANSLSYSKTGKTVYSVTWGTGGSDNKQQIMTLTHPLKVYQPYTSAGKKVDLTNGDGPTCGPGQRDRVVSQAKINQILSTIAYFKQTSEDEYSICDFYITIQHEDKYLAGENTFKETLHVTQYPGMYITALPGVKDRYVDTGSSIYASIQMANVLINGICENSNLWTSVIGLNSATYLNWNPNMYQITITRLNTNEYTIADPRRVKINNNLNNTSMSAANINKEYPDAWASFATAQVIDKVESKRTLKYYHPTDEREETKMMVAPKFRICSSMGGTGAILDRNEARRRGAAYQEMGFCAGRWRLPTWGEISFIIGLSETYKIPRLFGDFGSTWYYWCAQGAARIPPKGNTTIKPGVVGENVVANTDNWRARYVYDEWFWGEGQLKASGKPNDNKPVYTFTWGDLDYSIDYGR